MKYLIIIVFVTISFISCDRVHPYYYQVINKSDQTLSVHLVTRLDTQYEPKIDSTIVIEKDSSKVIYIAGDHGAEGLRPSDSPECFDIKQLEITFADGNKKNLSDKLHWAFEHGDDDNYIGLYKLIVKK